jgi:hypothetical protein
VIEAHRCGPLRLLFINPQPLCFIHEPTTVADIDLDQRLARVPGERRDQFEAMRQVAASGPGPANQLRSTGLLDQMEGLSHGADSRRPHKQV